MRDVQAVAIGDARQQLLVELPRPRSNEPGSVAAGEGAHDGLRAQVLHSHQDVPLRLHDAQERHDVLVLQGSHGAHLGRDVQNLIDRGVLALGEDLHRLSGGGADVVGQAHNAASPPAQGALQPQPGNGVAHGDCQGQGRVKRRKAGGQMQVADASPCIFCPLLAQRRLLLPQAVDEPGAFLLPHSLLELIPSAVCALHAL
mmetsp:Transcript_4298/g.12181  ORF Transcript_4298/g.12181 Transcript_4298/m.12181 type:complete len:201 (-) Transcript_4298:493-1095(-)